jgi:hypothetical protein
MTKQYQAMLILPDQTATPVSVPMTDHEARAEVDRIKNEWYLKIHAERAGGWYEVRPAK